MDLSNYFRRETSEVSIGAVSLGGPDPIRIQSMTSTSIMDTEVCMEQTKRIVDAGGEYVWLTTQGVKEAENLININIRLRSQGYTVPSVVDVHFNSKVADVAAQYAEKVWISPGSYVDAARTFKKLEYTGKEYAQEVQKIYGHFVPSLNTYKEIHTVIRIGINHGSLSDRVMPRYGDIPEGMVKFRMEFLCICVAEHFADMVISIKASSTVAMVKTVHLFAVMIGQEGMPFPLYLGVTEAGDGEDGRIRSALGIGVLLCDELGDTIYVSLSEAPGAEIPVARKLVDYVLLRQDYPHIPGMEASELNYFSPSRHRTRAVWDIGGEHLPVVIVSRMDRKTEVNPQFTPSYIHAGRTLPEQREEGVGYILDVDIWEGEAGTWSAFNHAQLPLMGECSAELKFLFIPYMAQTDEVTTYLKVHPEVVATSQNNRPNRLGEYRALVHQLMAESLENPVIFSQRYTEDEAEDLQIKSAVNMGALIFGGLCDGIFLFNQGSLSHVVVDTTAFGILQARRIYTSKTEYVSCSGCGRTLYDLEKTVARIKTTTSHLKSLKIGIMECIANNPGEVTDANYGYIGTGCGKISPYKGKTCVEKNIPGEKAMERLLEFIHNDRKGLES